MSRKLSTAWAAFSSSAPRHRTSVGRAAAFAERERFVQLFDQAPTFLALLRGKDHVIELANPGYLKLIRPSPGGRSQTCRCAPDAVAQGYLALLDEVYRTGNPYSADGAKYAVQVSPGARSMSGTSTLYINPSPTAITLSAAF